MPQLNQHTAAQRAVCTVALKPKPAPPCLPPFPSTWRHQFQFTISSNLVPLQLTHILPRWPILSSSTSSFSSSGATTSPFESFGLLNRSLPLTPACMHIVQLFTLIILKPSIISFSHLIFGLPANLAHFGFHSHNFFDHPVIYHSVHVFKPAEYAGLNVLNYILIYNSVIQLIISFNSPRAIPVPCTFENSS